MSTLAVVTLSMPVMSFAEDSIENMSIKDAMASMSPDVKAKMNGVTFKFGKGTGSTSGTEYKTVRRANGTFKDVSESCNRAFYSNLIYLAGEAKREGKTEVVNIQSNWKNNTTSSTTTYVCADGLWQSGVALKGNVA